MRVILVLTIISHLFYGFAQAPPATDIFLAEINASSENPTIAAVRNLTNRDGYDNQPCFLADGDLLYTSIRDDGQADIFRLDPESTKSERLTFTQESEYSPTPMPKKRAFSVVRVEHDGTQRLWSFPLKGGPPQLLLPDIKPVGYHAWLDSKRVALFILGNAEGAPHRLLLANINGSKPEDLLPDIGRGLRKTPAKNAVTVIHKATDTQWYIREIDLKTRVGTNLTPTLKGSEDFEWTSDGALLMAQESSLYRFRPGIDQNWIKLADLSGQGLKQITRIALRSDGKAVALVSTR